MCAAMLWVSEVPARSYEKPQLCQHHYQISSVGYKWDWRVRGPSIGMNDKRDWAGKRVNPACFQLDSLAAKPLTHEWERLRVPQERARETALSSSLQWKGKLGKTSLKRR